MDSRFSDHPEDPPTEHLVGCIALAVLYFANGRHLSITGLAGVLALGQCFLIVSLGVLSRRRGTAEPVVSSGLESAVPAPVPRKVR